MFSFYLLWCLGYLVLHAWLSYQWPPKHQLKARAPLPLQTSFIIPFRNERQNAPRLALEIRKIQFPDLEIILVDDQSEDGSFEILSELLEDVRGVRLLKSPGIGKKAALSHGISHSRGALIVTSDADCSFPENWIEKLSRPFQHSAIQLVAGPVVASLRGNSIFGKFQQIEWLSILMLTQVSFLRKQPLMCSGANLAFRKKAFEEVGGYLGNEQVLSGDDEFLLKKMVSYYGPESCVYVPAREVLVATQAQTSWTDLIRQRIRWAGKWKSHQSFSHASYALLAFMSQGVWIGSLVVFVGDWHGLLFLLTIWGVKILAEKLSLGRVGLSLGQRLEVKDYIFTSLIHPFYVLGVGLGTLFIKVKWKGRSQEDSLI